MLSKIFLSVFVLVGLFFCINPVYAATVDVTAHVYEDFTIFNYIFKFDANDSFNKFSVEKPIDAQLSYVVDQDGSVEYDLLGDYFVFRPKYTEDNVFLLKYKSYVATQDIYSSDAFKTYIGLDFEADVLTFNVNLNYDFGDVLDVFPEAKSHEVDKISWEIYNTSAYSLFVVNYKEAFIDEHNNSNENDNSFVFYLVLFISVPLLIFIVFIIYLQTKDNSKKKNDGDNGNNDSENGSNRDNGDNNDNESKDIRNNKNAKLSNKENNKLLKNNKESKKEKDDGIEKSKTKESDDSNVGSIKDIIDVETHSSNITIETDDSLSINLDSSVDKKDKIIDEEKEFEETIEKHLTSNEKNIVKLIKGKEGITQQDILNYIPKLTKSNLSKIIAKLNARHMLSKIRVGKINKIYLGDKFKKKE